MTHGGGLELREAEARAAQQREITESELSITVRTNEGKAETQRVMQQAAQLRAMAEAEADKLRTLAQAEATKMERIAQAEAERTARVGIAEALAIDEQVRAYGGPRLRVAQHVLERFAQAIERSGVDVVPRIVMNGTSPAGVNGEKGPGSGNMLESLVALALTAKLEDAAVVNGPRNPRAEALSAELRKSLDS